MNIKQRCLNLAYRLNPDPYTTPEDEGRWLAAGFLLVILFIGATVAIAGLICGLIAILGKWLFIIGLPAGLIALFIYASGDSKK